MTPRFDSLAALEKHVKDTLETAFPNVKIDYGKGKNIFKPVYTRKGVLIDCLRCDVSIVFPIMLVENSYADE